MQHCSLCEGDSLFVTYEPTIEDERRITMAMIKDELKIISDDVGKLMAGKIPVWADDKNAGINLLVEELLACADELKKMVR